MSLVWVSTKNKNNTNRWLTLWDGGSEWSTSRWLMKRRASFEYRFYRLSAEVFVFDLDQLVAFLLQFQAQKLMAAASECGTAESTFGAAIYLSDVGMQFCQTQIHPSIITRQFCISNPKITPKGLFIIGIKLRFVIGSNFTFYFTAFLPCMNFLIIIFIIAQG